MQWRASRLTARCHAKLGFARVWVRWLARAHAGRKAGVAGTHLEGRVETVRDRAVRESLAEAQAQGAKEDGEPDAEEAHPGVELSHTRAHNSASK